MALKKQGDHHIWLRKNLDGTVSAKIRPIRWLVCLALALCFVLSYYFDLQALEGSMIASRLMGFHMVDLFSGIEVIFSHGEIATNLSMGFLLVTIIYAILGGRTFCSWACPYGLLSEWGEILHKKLVEKKLIKKRKKTSTKWKFYIAACFLLSSFFSGYLVYQYVNLVGITSRILIYGLFETAIIIVFILIIEVFFLQRFWCRTVCPSGATFGLLGKISPIKIFAQTSRCDKCGSCSPECLSPEVLKVVFTDKEKRGVYLTSTDCTMCGKCIDVCNRKVFSYDHRLKKII